MNNGDKCDSEYINLNGVYTELFDKIDVENYARSLINHISHVLFMNQVDYVAPVDIYTENRRLTMSEITIFAKQRKTADGRMFYSYVATLRRKDGTNQTVGVKFRGDHMPRPESCPCNINVNKSDMNLSTRDITLKNGEPGKGYTLWVSAWTPGKPYVDHSLDDFDI